MSSNLVFTGTRKLIFIESLLSSNSNLATFEVSIPLSSWIIDTSLNSVAYAISCLDKNSGLSISKIPKFISVCKYSFLKYFNKYFTKFVIAFFPNSGCAAWLATPVEIILTILSDVV